MSNVLTCSTLCSLSFLFPFFPFIFFPRVLKSDRVPFPEVPTKRQMLLPPFHSRLGSVVLSHVATVGGRLNDCENFKKTLVGVQWYSVHVSQTALPLPACRNPGSPTPKTKASGVATFPLGTRPSPSQKGEDPRVP